MLIAIILIANELLFYKDHWRTPEKKISKILIVVIIVSANFIVFNFLCYFSRGFPNL